MPPAHTPTCDIFCAVIDNFGDIGVCWRLARQLAHEHGWRVRLFVDDLHAFQKLCPAVITESTTQTIEGIIIEPWRNASPEVADVVIEAFACELPPVYVAAMAQRARAPVWLNLEYLSAEAWVEQCHLRPSPHPCHTALSKTFFFPGFTPDTGGVLKERDLDAARSAFEHSPAARAAWWHHAIGEPLPGDDATIISLFAYENPSLASLLAQWSAASAPIILLAPQGRVCGAIARYFGLPAFNAGAHAQRGALRAYGLPFTNQRGYDTLLWASDLNFVRGEDSFVRAQWAMRPFVWQIYAQAGNAHFPKLDAAFERYAQSLPTETHAALRRFWHAWNGQGMPDWSDFAQHLPALRQRAVSWAAELAQAGDLAGNLVSFVQSQLK